MGTIINIFVSAVALYGGASLLSGVKINSFVQAIIVALVIGLLNVTLGILLKIVTLGILSLGIFRLLLDAILIQVADNFLDGFEVKNFWWALALAAIVAVISSILDGFVMV
ncbi:MAG: phage holin family protein [Bacteroidota bacterium]